MSQTRTVLLFGFVLLAHSALGQSVNLTSTYHSYPVFYVGDSWTLAIDGAADSLVEIAATQNASSLGTTPFGYTDCSGILIIDSSEEFVGQDWLRQLGK
jgi:hypothetical protein